MESQTKTPSALPQIFSKCISGEGLEFSSPSPLPVLSAYNLTFFINWKRRLAASSVIHTFSSEYSLSYFLSENVQNFTICIIIWILFLPHFILSFDNGSPIVLPLQCLCIYFQDTEVTLYQVKRQDCEKQEISWRSLVHMSVQRNKVCRTFDSVWHEALPSSPPML